MCEIETQVDLNALAETVEENKGSLASKGGVLLCPEYQPLNVDWTDSDDDELDGGSGGGTSSREPAAGAQPQLSSFPAFGSAARAVSLQSVAGKAGPNKAGPTTTTTTTTATVASADAKRLVAASNARPLSLQEAAFGIGWKQKLQGQMSTTLVRNSESDIKSAPASASVPVLGVPVLGVPVPDSASTETSQQWVRICVGSSVHVTTRRTLARCLCLSRLVSGPPMASTPVASMPGCLATYCLDRNGTAFGYILDYLRSEGTRTKMPRDYETLSALAQDAEAFGLERLAVAARSKICAIDERDSGKGSGMGSGVRSSVGSGVGTYNIMAWAKVARCIDMLASRGLIAPLEAARLRVRVYKADPSIWALYALYSAVTPETLAKRMRELLMVDGALAPVTQLTRQGQGHPRRPHAPVASNSRMIGMRSSMDTSSRSRDTLSRDTRDRKVTDG